jgi:hypothetical protein
MRFGNFKGASSLDQGFNTRNGKQEPVWYTFDGPQFRNERFADEVYSGIDHTGWFADPDQANKMRGIVASLPHGKFLAGYWQSMNDERAYFSDIYDDEKEAARAADHEAEKAAEKENEYQERWRAASDLDDEIKAIESRVSELYALRNHKKLGEDAREELSTKLDELRVKREKLKTEYKDIQL